MQIILPNGRKIGDGHEPFIIAEIGSNYKTIEDCVMSIEQAKACGADAVKFQLYNERALYGCDTGRTLPGELDPAWLSVLHKTAITNNIEFMCSAFSPELVDVVDPYVNIHKVASAEMAHLRILEKLKQKKKPVFISTGGGHTEQEINLAVKVLCPTDLVLLYCVAAYPANGVELATIPFFRNLYNKLVGFSDHTVGLCEAERAVKHGACVMEKHVNFTRHKNTPDAKHSINGYDFALMVKSVREAKLWIVPRIEEYEMVSKHNRRLMCIKNIFKGEKLQENVNFGIYRSLKIDISGLSPFAIDQVNGCVANRGYAPGDSIGPEIYGEI